MIANYSLPPCLSSPPRKQECFDKNTAAAPANALSPLACLASHANSVQENPLSSSTIVQEHRSCSGKRISRPSLVWSGPLSGLWSLVPSVVVVVVLVGPQVLSLSGSALWLMVHRFLGPRVLCLFSCFYCCVLCSEGREHGLWFLFCVGFLLC